MKYSRPVHGLEVMQMRLLTGMAYIYRRHHEGSPTPRVRNTQGRMPSSGLCETLQTQILSKKRLLAEFTVGNNLASAANLAIASNQDRCHHDPLNPAHACNPPTPR